MGLWPTTFGGSVHDDIHRQLKNLEEQHVRAVRGLENLTRSLGHVQAARGELAALSKIGEASAPLHDLHCQLGSVEETLREEVSRTQGYILDVELDQDSLRRRLQGEGSPENS
jgi:hypothetical protein